MEESKQDYIGVHLKHCYQGEYKDGCKYGEDNCPANPLEQAKKESGFEFGAEWKEIKYKAIMEELLSKQREVVSSPIRFNGVHVNDIVEVFKKHGISFEINILLSLQKKIFQLNAMSCSISANDKYLRRIGILAR